MKKKIICIMLGTVLMFGGIQQLGIVQASDTEENYEITSLEELVENVEELSDEENSAKKGDELIESTEPDVIGEYLEYIDEQATEMLETAEPIETYATNGDKTVTAYEVEVDPISKVELVIEDAPEETILSKIDNLFTLEVQAASNGEEVWKKYGNRYFTAKYTRYIGTGYATICTENHP